MATPRHSKVVALVGVIEPEERVYYSGYIAAITKDRKAHRPSVFTAPKQAHYQYSESPSGGRLRTRTFKFDVPKMLMVMHELETHLGGTHMLLVWEREVNPNAPRGKWYIYHPDSANKIPIPPTAKTAYGWLEWLTNPGEFYG